MTTLPAHPAYPVFTPDKLATQLAPGEAACARKRNFCVLGVRSVQPALPEIELAIEEKLRALKLRRLLLTQDGVANPNEGDNRFEYAQRRRWGMLLDVRAIQMALTDIPLCITTQLTPEQRACTVMRLNNSYGLKHRLERYRERVRGENSRGYITNGDFCMAMLLLGFPIRRMPRTQNLLFRCAFLDGVVAK